MFTDSDHKERYGKGFYIRTDNNNFMAEMAAAATVINAIPREVPCIPVDRFHRNYTGILKVLPSQKESFSVHPAEYG